MKSIIGRKQRASNEDFIYAWNHIEDLVSKDEITLLMESSVERVLRAVRGKHVGYAWSGGKDSIALQCVCEAAGINECIIGLAGELEYHEFIEWVVANKPSGLHVFNNEHLNFEWLSRHQEMLFPHDASTAAHWFKIIQHRAQDWFYKTQQLDMILLGRRIQDGNYVGKDGIYTNAKGITRFSPIADWKHEHVLAAIHYFMNDNLPPIYGWKNGFVVGTGCFAARQYCDSVQQGWKDVYEIDKTMVIKAAEYIESAALFLESINNN